MPSPMTVVGRGYFDFSYLCQVRGTISLVLETDPSVASLYFNKKERMKNCYKELKVQDLDGKDVQARLSQEREAPFSSCKEEFEHFWNMGWTYCQMPRAFHGHCQVTRSRETLLDSAENSQTLCYFISLAPYITGDRVYRGMGWLGNTTYPPG